METPIGDNDNSHLGDFIENPGRPFPYRLRNELKGLREAIR